MRSGWRWLGPGLIGAGVLVAVAGVVGGLAADDEDPTTAPVSASSSTTTPATTSRSAPTSTSALTTSSTARPTTTTAPPVEDPNQFAAGFQQAFRTGDLAYAIARLHPANATRYGADACRQYLERITRPDPSFTLGQPGPIESWDWVTDGRSQVFPSALPVPASRAGPAGQTQRFTLHAVLHDGVWKWFTDCGTPI